MRLKLVLILLIFLSAGCYLSTGRSFVMPEDTSVDRGADFLDAPDMDADLDTGDPDLETDVPQPSCLYEATGERRLADFEHSTTAPRIFWNNSEVGVVLFESGGMMIEHIFVSHTNVAADLSSQSPLKKVGEESHGWGEPAWTGDGFGLCWYTDPGMVGRTAFKLVSRDGDQIGSRVDPDFDGEACLDLDYGNGGFLAAWRHRTFVDEEVIIDSRIQVLDGSGNPVAEPMDLARGPYPGTSPTAVFTGSEFLVAVAQSTEIELFWIDASGSVTRQEAVAAPDAAYAAVAQSGGSIALTWSTGERFARGLHVRVYDAELRPLGDEIVIAQDGSSASHQATAPVPDGWAVAWHQGPMEDEVAMLLHLDHDGIPIEPRFPLHEGRNSSYGGPVLVSVGAELYAALSYPPHIIDGYEQVHLMRLQCADRIYEICEPQDAEVIVTCDDPESQGWQWNGAACIELSGCPGDCVGEDCDRLARSPWDCASDHGHCP